MPRKKKTARDMTNEELARSVFPKKVRDKLDEEAHKGEPTTEKPAK